MSKTYSYVHYIYLEVNTPWISQYIILGYVIWNFISSWTYHGMPVLYQNILGGISKLYKWLLYIFYGLVMVPYNNIIVWH